MCTLNGTPLKLAGSQMVNAAPESFAADQAELDGRIESIIRGG